MADERTHDLAGCRRRHSTAGPAAGQHCDHGCGCRCHPPETDPWTTVVEGLAAHARGETVDQDAMDEACTLLAAAQLVELGMSVEQVERQFRDRDHRFKVTYDRATKDLTIDVIWDDGDTELEVDLDG